MNLTSKQVVASVPVGRSPAGVVASSAAGRVFVSNPDSKTISVIDMRMQKVGATLPAGDGPVGIDAAPDGSRFFAADWDRVLDARSGRTLARIATGRNSRGFGAFIGAPAAP